MSVSDDFANGSAARHDGRPSRLVACVRRSDHIARWPHTPNSSRCRALRGAGLDEFQFLSPSLNRMVLPSGAPQWQFEGLWLPIISVSSLSLTCPTITVVPPGGVRCSADGRPGVNNFDTDMSWNCVGATPHCSPRPQRPSMRRRSASFCASLACTENLIRL